MKSWVREKLGPEVVIRPAVPAEKEVPVSEPQIQQPPQAIALTAADLQAIIATAVATAIQESKRLPAEEQEALDEQKRRKQEARVSRVKEALQDQRLMRQQQLNCGLGGHVKYSESTADTAVDRKHAMRGQVNSDNCCRPVCIRCQKVFPPFKVTEENMKSGMSLGNITRLTPQALYEAHRRSFPGCKECAKGLCAVRDQRELNQRHLDPDPEILPTGKVRVADLTAATV